MRFVLEVYSITMLSHFILAYVPESFICRAATPAVLALGEV